MNRVDLIGNAGKRLELSATKSGVSVVKGSIATSDKRKDKLTGQWVDETEWHNIKAFGRTAEVMHQYLQKGSKVYIEGKLKTDEYEKDGVKKFFTYVLVNKMEMLDKKSEPDSNQKAPAQAASDFDDDIPF